MYYQLVINYIKVTIFVKKQVKNEKETSNPAERLQKKYSWNQRCARNDERKVEISHTCRFILYWQDAIYGIKAFCSQYFAKSLIG